MQAYAAFQVSQCRDQTLYRDDTFLFLSSLCPSSLMYAISLYLVSSSFRASEARTDDHRYFILSISPAWSSPSTSLRSWARRALCLHQTIHPFQAPDVSQCPRCLSPRRHLPDRLLLLGILLFLIPSSRLQRQCLPAGYISSTFDIVSSIWLVVVGLLIRKTGTFKRLLLIFVLLFILVVGLMI